MSWQPNDYHPVPVERAGLSNGSVLLGAVDEDDHGELVERLVAFGLDEREAKLFVHLMIHGPSRASDAAAATKLRRTETYRALEALAQRGFLTARLTRPVIYEVVSLEALFTDLFARHEQRKADMLRLRERVETTLAAAQESRPQQAERLGYKVLQGRRAILASVETALRQAKGGQSMVSTIFRPFSATLQNRAYQITLRRAAEGLPMRLLLRDEPGMERALQPLLAYPHVNIRFFEPAHPIRFTVIDSREIIYWLVTDPSDSVDARDDVAMWTNAPDFIAAQQTLYEALWRSGRPASSAKRA